MDLVAGNIKAHVMRSNPIEPAPGMNKKREINWGFEDLPDSHLSPPRRRWRFVVRAALFVTAGLPILFVASVLNNSGGPRENLLDAGSTSGATVASSQLEPSRENLGTSARVTALIDARTEAEKALQSARASVAEQKLALEQEQQRRDVLLRELAAAREEVATRKAAADAADASSKNALASATEQTQAAERERQRGEVLAHQLASARVDIETLTARVTALTEERSDAEKALHTAQALAAQQKRALEQERERGDTFLVKRQEVGTHSSANAAAASAKNPLVAATKTKAAAQARQRGEALAHQLASAREDLGTLTARVTALTDARSEAEKALQAAQTLAAEQKLALEQERERGEVLAHQLASARGDLETLTARVTALTDARSEAEKALQTAQASAAGQQLALEQEHQRGDALLRDLASAREEVEARKAAANAADASMKNAQASAAEQTQAAEQERQRGEVLAHQLASAREDLGTLTARVTALTDARSEAEKALQTPPASVAEQKLALEQERERGEVLAHQLASAREDLETLTARVTALTDARSEAEKALQTAQASAAGQQLALEQEHQRGDALLRDLASAREEVEARKAAAYPRARR